MNIFYFTKIYLMDNFFYGCDLKYKLEIFSYTKFFILNVIKKNNSYISIKDSNMIITLQQLLHNKFEKDEEKLIPHQS